jgi:phenylpropionate dioxygenase-like ring-hydroxylating dioxygenase large terminal subunit
MFLKNCWYVGAWDHEIMDGKLLERRILNEPVVFYRGASGRVVALDNRCCHRGAKLSQGRIEEDSVRCMYHGLKFDPSGKCVQIPGQERIPPQLGVKSYPVVDRDHLIWIWMGDPALADPKIAPAFHWYDAPSWAGCGACLDVKANYLLLVDNLLDLSHLAFLHIKTIGAADDTDPHLTWERQDNLLRGVRIARNLSPSQRQIAQGDTLRTDSTKIMTFTPPANVVIEIGAVEAGKTEDDPTNRVSRKLVVLDSMTPETDTSCHYFWGNCRNYAIDDAGVTEMVLKSTSVAFDEDKLMLEAEQRIIDLNPAAPQIDLIGDAGGLQARRIVERLLAEEQAPARAAE